MSKGFKLGIILFAGALTAGLGYYFMIYRPAHPKSGSNNNNSSSDTSSSNGTANSGLGSSGTSASSEIGKTAYAKGDGVIVLKADGSTYKIASKNEWIGTIVAKRTMGGKPYYQLSGDRYVVQYNVYYS